ncbi:hypothetical protein [Selenomonas ruminantium]|uniref:hypothetical protein n=1 Tax=Selenomonas ruminantium TaxID=971 RepID=UPI0026F2CF7A|nr:hypothetical protein [Selenomonas ruminantium]
MLQIKKQKAQSIVGYALILAFAAALAVLFYTDDMRGAFQTVYAKLETKLGAGAGRPWR